MQALGSFACHAIISAWLVKPLWLSGCRMQEDVLLSFKPEATGISWEAYVNLYCAGAKQLFFHEKPKMRLELEPVVLSNM